MVKYIDADILRKDIEFAKSVYNNSNRVVNGVADAYRQDGRAAMCDDILKKIDSLQQDETQVDKMLCSQVWWEEQGWIMIPPDATIEGIDSLLKQVRKKLQQKQQNEQPEYGYITTKYIPGKKPRWKIGSILAYYICTSNEEGEYTLGKIVNIDFDGDDWIYTFEDGGVSDEQSLIEDGAYKKS